MNIFLNIVLGKIVKRFLLLGVLLCTLAATLPGITQEDSPPPERETIRVGSKLFPEDILLSYLVLVALEQAGYPVENMTETGNTNTTRNALLNSLIDIYVEYTGTAFTVFFEQATIGEVDVLDSQSIYAIVASYDSAFYDIIWLEPAPVYNTFVMVVMSDFAEEHDVYTLTDFARYVNEGGVVRFAANEEYIYRSDGLQAAEEAYGFDLTGSQILVIADADTDMLTQALISGVNNINVVLSTSVSSFIFEYDLYDLYDDQNLLLPYEPTPIIRGPLLRRNPEIVTILNPIFRSLDNKKLINLIAQVELFDVPYRQVAEDYLAALAEGGDISDITIFEFEDDFDDDE